MDTILAGAPTLQRCNGDIIMAPVANHSDVHLSKYVRIMSTHKEEYLVFVNLSALQTIGDYIKQVADHWDMTTRQSYILPSASAVLGYPNAMSPAMLVSTLGVILDAARLQETKKTFQRRFYQRPIKYSALIQVFRWLYAIEGNQSVF